MSARNTVIFRIKNRYLLSVILEFPINVIERAGFWCIVSLLAISSLLQTKTSLFFNL